MDETRYDLLEIIGFSAEVAEPNSASLTAFYTDRHLNPILDKLVEYVEAQREAARAEERERTQGIIEELENHIDHLPGHIRAQVKALPVLLNIPSGRGEYAVLQSDVLALLKGGNDADA